MTMEANQMNKTKAIRILYMEDDRGMAWLLQKKLKREGHVVDIAADGKIGLMMHEKDSYDLLIVDHKMPGYSGLDVIHTLASRGKLPPTVMLTGAGDEKTAVEAMKLGASDYIIKDVDGGYLELMPSVIVRALNHKGLADEKERAEAELRRAHEELERLVDERTKELLQANRALEEEILERKRVEKQLRHAHDKLETLVKMRTKELEGKNIHLEELNVTLKVLLKKREDDQRGLEESILMNVKKLIMPCLEELKKSPYYPFQAEWVDRMAFHINEIISPFVKKLSSPHINLTPTEIRVATLIKEGRSSKEIAALLVTSESAVLFHRHNLRKKLGLNNHKINLRSYLHSLQ
jgi:DNA-binding NarL/FixJ family response regulator